MKKFFKLDIFDLEIEHIKEASCYNHNLYKIIGNYGDSFVYTPDVLFVREDCYEDIDCFEYTILVRVYEREIKVMSFVGEERIYTKEA